MIAGRPETSGLRDPRHSSTAMRGKNPACPRRPSRTSWKCPWNSIRAPPGRAIARGGILRRRRCGAQRLRFCSPVSSLVFYRAALRLGLRVSHAMSGNQIIQRGFHVLVPLALVGENLIVHRSLIGEFAAAVDDEKTRRRLGAIAARDAAVEVE